MTVLGVRVIHRMYVECPVGDAPLTTYTLHTPSHLPFVFNRISRANERPFIPNDSHKCLDCTPDLLQTKKIIVDC